MNPLYFILLLVVGVAAFWAGRVTSPSRQQVGANLFKLKKGEEAKGKILKLIRKKGKIKNNDVEELLGVKDAMATRYLDELEDGGKIKQVGSGKGSYYKIMR